MVNGSVCQQRPALNQVESWGLALMGSPRNVRRSLAKEVKPERWQSYTPAGNTFCVNEHFAVHRQHVAVDDSCGLRDDPA